MKITWRLEAKMHLWNTCTATHHNAIHEITNEVVLPMEQKVRLNDNV